MTARNTAFSAILFTRSISFAPSDRASSAFTPTAVPTPTAIIRLWIGNAIDTAVSAFSLTLATKILSTTL